MKQSKMGRAEFIALIAMTFATIAFSVDAMLPALPRIGAELSPDNLNRAQLIVASFLMGMGVGTFFTGPLSDSWGRKPVIYGGAAVYITGAVLAWSGTTLETVLVGRVLQGLGAAAARVVSLAIMRDLFSGREMARMMSIAMSIFTIFPAIAPLVGAGIIALGHWRDIFLAFIVFSLISVLWLGLRLPEPLPPLARRPFRRALLLGALRELIAHPVVRLTVLAQGFCLGMIFTMITLVQPVYDEIFNRADSFPFWFGAVALVAGSASLLNAVLVVRLGMRRIITWALVAQMLLALGATLLSRVGLPDGVMFAIFVAFQASVFSMGGMTMGNLNAIAMEPMGHIAGMAASILGALSTIMAALLAALIGMLFNATVLPLTLGILGLSAAGLGVMILIAGIERRMI